MQRWAPIVLCSMPLLVSLPTLGDPFGNSEESLNAAIWSLAARNLLELGPVTSVRGAVVSPHGGTRGDGVYAHHPPLPVWLMTVPVALGGWEGFSRLLALGCAGASLGLLWRLLSMHCEPRAALLGLAAASLSVFALRYGRLFTTVTLMVPLFLGLLLAQHTRSRWSFALVPLLVLSSWDGVVAAAVVIASCLLPASRFESALTPALSPQGERGRVLGLGAVFALSLAFVGWHLIDATHGLDELLWQFRWRAAGDEVTWLQWAGRQALQVGEGVGPVALAALLVAFARERTRTFWLLAAPGLVMLLVFRQGAVKHAFWGYALILPAAFAVARLPRAAPLIALQGALCLGLAAYRLSEEHVQNQLGHVARQLPRGEEIAVLARGSFHPYVSWYANGKPLTVRQLSELPPRDDGTALVDATYARELGCTLPAEPRWQIIPLRRLKDSCASVAATKWEGTTSICWSSAAARRERRAPRRPRTSARRSR